VTKRLKSVLLYSVFAVILIAVAYGLSTFRFSGVLGVATATAVLSRYLKRLSVVVLSAIVVLVTVVFPMLILFRMQAASGVELSHYLAPVNTPNVLNDIEFVLPCLTFVAIYAVIDRLPGKQ